MNERNKTYKKSAEEVGFFNVREPNDSIDYVNMYGTYNIQPTADHGNEYPAIAQGLSKVESEERARARAEWKEQQAQKPESGGKLEADHTKGHDGSVPNLLSERKNGKKKDV